MAKSNGSKKRIRWRTSYRIWIRCISRIDFQYPEKFIRSGMSSKMLLKWIQISKSINSNLGGANQYSNQGRRWMLSKIQGNELLYHKQASALGSTKTSSEMTDMANLKFNL